MNINVSTGEVTLPDGSVVSAQTTLSRFQAEELQDVEEEFDFGVAFGGEIEGKPLEIHLTFQKQRLYSVSCRVLPYTREMSDAVRAEVRADEGGAGFGFEIEEQMQKVHARLMQQWLGPPHRVVADPAVASSVLPYYPTLVDTLIYDFDWGSAWCGYDCLAMYGNFGLRYIRQAEYEHRERERQRRVDASSDLVELMATYRDQHNRQQRNPD